MKLEIKRLMMEATTTFLQSKQADVALLPEIALERPREKSHGDFASNIAMLLAKPMRMSPRDIATQIVSHFPKSEAIASVEVAGAGFINITLSQKVLTDALYEMAHDPHLGVACAMHPKTIVVDYSSPNLAKEMHVGHLRSTIIGDAIARVLMSVGHHVIRHNHVGDWGTQFGMLLAHLEDMKGLDDTVLLADLETFYKAAKKRFDEEEGFADRARQMVVKLQAHDPNCIALWTQFIDISLSHCQAVYQRLNVMLKREDVRAESAYNDDLPGLIDTLNEQGLLVTDEGAKCVFLDAFVGKEGETLPIIVQKKDGGYLYATTDLAAIQYRAQALHADDIYYVVDARQSLHFQQIFALARRAQLVDEKVQLHHIGFGMVLDKSGRPYKSRDGGVTKLSSLLDEAVKRAAHLIASKNPDLPQDALNTMADVVGIASVKYADLSKNRISDYIFDWDTMISFEGNTAPYLLYAYTRVQSLLVKAAMTPPLDASFILSDDAEMALAKHLLQYGALIETVAQKATPHLLCAYLYELACLFSSFYEACPILVKDESIKNSRLRLSMLTAAVLQKGLSLLGIPTLERM